MFGFAASLLTKGIEIEIKKIVHFAESGIDGSKDLNIVRKDR